MGKSNYLEDKLLNWIKGTAFGTAPSAVYVGLFSVTPADSGGGTEVTTTIDATGRKAVTFGSITTNTGANTMANNADVDFGDADGAATLVAFGIFDASSAGNLLYWAPLTGQPITIVTGNLVKFATGALVVSED